MPSTNAAQRVDILNNTVSHCQHLCLSTAAGLSLQDFFTLYVATYRVFRVARHAISCRVMLAIFMQLIMHLSSSIAAMKHQLSIAAFILNLTLHRDPTILIQITLHDTYGVKERSACEHRNIRLHRLACTESYRCRTATVVAQAHSINIKHRILSLRPKSRFNCFFVNVIL